MGRAMASSTTWLAFLVLGATVPPLGAFMPCVNLRSNAVSLRSATPCRLQQGFHIAKPPARVAPLRVHAAAENIRTPDSIASMMEDAAGGILAGIEAGVQRMAVEVPLPITGGTELDDWPGGIGQKYETVRPMLQPTLKSLGFSAEEIATRKFMSLEDDAIGIWQRTGGDGKLMSVVCFATPEVLGGLQDLAAKGTLILVNHQFFLDQFSKQETKDFIGNAELVYLLQSLNMKGPGLLPIKGVLKRM